MARFKVKAIPRLRHYKLQKRSALSKSAAAEPPMTDRGAVAGTTERTTVHQQKQGWKQITNETIAERLVRLHKQETTQHALFASFAKIKNANFEH